MNCSCVCLNRHDCLLVVGNDLSARLSSLAPWRIFLHMPNRSKSPCSYPGCHELVDKPGKCEKHRRQVVRDKDIWRDSPSKRGYGSRWRKARERYLRANPLCVKCLNQGDVVAANVVDHIVAHKGNDALMWDESNYQALCKTCHDSKTATEDGGFGRNK